MKRVIMCTAGHVDHGKTSLVHALTGIDCDTHPEEKARGITINPGFAHLTLPALSPAGEDVCIGIVDVPGHHRFIRNMLAGACGVDLALLVVAADDGVMPQTREHIALLDLLGVREGLTALTKVDLAGPDLVDLAQQDVRDSLAASFLAGAETVPVSAKSGVGLDDLRSAIGRVVDRVTERSLGGSFRMYIDRIFSVAGFGTVVTGSVMGGSVRVDDSLFVLPGEIPVRVRRIERHGAEVAVAHAGERASLNLSGLARAQFVRGMVLADQLLGTTRRFDGEIRVIGEKTSLDRRAQALLYAGTHETSCQIHLLDRDTARAGDRVLAQIEIEQPAVLLPDDRFVLRSASADLTLGGGRCIDPAPLHHRRRTDRVVREVRRRASDSLADRVAAEVQKRISFVGARELSAVLAADVSAVRTAVPSIPEGDGVRFVATPADLYLIGRIGEERLTRAVRDAVAQYHRDDPLGTRGISAHQVASKLPLPAGQEAALAGQILDGLVVAGTLRRSDCGGYLLSGFVARGAALLAEASQAARARFRSAGLGVVSLTELESELVARFKLGVRDFKAIIKHLVEEGELVAADDSYLAREVVESCRQRLLTRLAAEDGISVAQFRDLIDGNRKVCLMLLGLFDREGVTCRNGDQRFITAKGRQALGANPASRESPCPP